MAAAAVGEVAKFGTALVDPIERAVARGNFRKALQRAVQNRLASIPDYLRRQGFNDYGSPQARIAYVQAYNERIYDIMNQAQEELLAEERRILQTVGSAKGGALGPVSWPSHKEEWFRKWLDIKPIYNRSVVGKGGTFRRHFKQQRRPTRMPLKRRSYLHSLYY